jgi:hypothetical protein
MNTLNASHRINHSLEDVSAITTKPKVKIIQTNDATITHKSLDNNFFVNKTPTTVATKSLFSETVIAFPHEDIIDKALKIINKNIYIGTSYDNTRKSILGKYKKITFNYTLPIFKPSEACIAAIAHHYNKKYNIEIYYVDKNTKDLLYKLAQQLPNGKQIGVIAILHPHSIHVTPLVFSKNNNKLYIVSIDSVSNSRSSQRILEESYLNLIKIYGEQNCHLLYAGTNRQTDGYSCINDAFVILKDALRKSNLIDDLVNSITEDITNDNKDEKSYKISIAPFPKFLYKTVQNKKLLDKLTTEDLQTPLNKSTDIPSRKGIKTLETHFKKYNRNIVATSYMYDYNNSGNNNGIAKNWEVNTYLQIKAYRMLARAFKIIENRSGYIDYSKTSKIERRYINSEILINNRDSTSWTYKLDSCILL